MLRETVISWLSICSLAAFFEEIDRYVSRWNNSDAPRTLAQYLGLNAEEEDVWIDVSDEALQDMLDSQKK